MEDIQEGKNFNSTCVLEAVPPPPPSRHC